MRNKTVILSVVLLPFCVCASTYTPCTSTETASDTCWSCGNTCTARLTIEDVLQEDGSTKPIGTMTISGEGSMNNLYDYTTINGSRTTTADWGSRISEINQVVIENGITNIGSYTFNGAKNLVHLELPESVSEIGDWAFLESSLKTINTLQNVTTYGSAVFWHSKLQSVDLSENLTRIENDFAPGTPLSEIKIPDNVTYIGSYAFSGCSSLNEVDIPDTVEYIEKKAFAGATYPIYCNNINNRCDDLFFGSVDTGIEENHLVKYTIENDKYLLDGNLYVSKDDMKQGPHESCGQTQEQCAAVLAEVESAVNCDSIKSCRTILEMAEDGKYCNSIEVCKGLVNGFNSEDSVKIGNKIYTSIDDFIDGNYVRYRIYTIDEANRVAGPINRVSIKYR